MVSHVKDINLIFPGGFQMLSSHCVCVIPLPLCSPKTASVRLSESLFGGLTMLSLKSWR